MVKKVNSGAIVGIAIGVAVIILAVVLLGNSSVGFNRLSASDLSTSSQFQLSYSFGADFYTEMFGTPAVSSGESPVGFDAFERFYCRVSDETGHETEHGFQMLKNSRRRAYECILASDTDLTGLSYRIDSVPSTADPLGRWLESSLGMVPAAGRPDVLFAPGDDALFAERSGRCGTGIDIGFPSSAYVDFSKAPVMGLDGAMYILGSLFNRAGRS